MLRFCGVICVDISKDGGKRIFGVADPRWLEQGTTKVLKITFNSGSKSKEKIQITDVDLTTRSRSWLRMNITAMLAQEKASEGCRNCYLKRWIMSSDTAC